MTWGIFCKKFRPRVSLDDVKATSCRHSIKGTKADIIMRPTILAITLPGNTRLVHHLPGGEEERGGEVVSRVQGEQSRAELTNKELRIIFCLVARLTPDRAKT